MFLKLTHRKYYGQASVASATQAELGPAPVYESQAMRRVADRLARFSGQSVLDLGVLTGESVTALAGAGARVHVHDWVSPLCRGGTADGSGIPGDGIELLPESVDVVLAWELFDLLPPEVVPQVLSRLSRWIVPKGLLISVFHSTPATQVHRFRVRAGGRVRVDAAMPLPTPSTVMTNNEVASIFAGWTLLQSSLVAGQMREVVVQRP